LLFFNFNTIARFIYFSGKNFRQEKKTDLYTNFPYIFIEHGGSKMKKMKNAERKALQNQRRQMRQLSRALAMLVIAASAAGTAQADVEVNGTSYNNLNAAASVLNGNTAYINGTVTQGTQIVYADTTPENEILKINLQGNDSLIDLNGGNRLIYHNVSFGQDGTLEVTGNGITIANGGNGGDGRFSGGVFAANKNLTVNGSMTFDNNNAYVSGGNYYSGGVLYSNTGNVVIDGSHTFTNNRAEDGAVVFIDNGSPVYRTLTIKGSNTFDSNTAESAYAASGAVAYVNRGDIFIEGTGEGNKFTNNTANNGDAVLETGGGYVQDADGVSFQPGNVTISGKNEFSGNSSLGSSPKTGNLPTAAGVIKASTGRTVTISGDNTFKNNTAVAEDRDAAGAILSSYVVFEGDGSTAVFEGNTANGVNNDVNAAGRITFQDNGTYSFGGGLVSNNLNVTTGANVTLEADSVNKFNHSATVDEDSTLTINSNDTTFGKVALNGKDPAKNSFTGTLNIGAGVDQEIGGDVTLGGNVNFTYDDAGEDKLGSIDLTEADSVTIKEGTNVGLLDKEGNAITAEDLKGTDIDETLISGGGEELANLNSSYDSLAYSVFAGYDANINGYVIRSQTNYDAIAAVSGNSAAAASLFGADIFDEANVDMIRDNVNALTGELYASNVHAHLQRMNYQTNMVNDRMRNLQNCDACSMCDCGPNFWFSSFGLGSSVDEHGNMNSYDYDAWGIMVGAEYAEGRNRMGIYYAYGQTDAESALSTVGSKDNSFGAYLQWNSFWGGGYSSAIASFSFSDNEGERQVFGRQVNDDYDSWMGLVRYEKGWETTGGLLGVLNPYVSLQYMRYEADGFQNDYMAVSNNRHDSLRSTLGFRLSKEWTSALCFTGGLAWHHEYLDENASFTATTDRGSAVIFGNGAGRDWMEMNLGAQYNITTNISISGDYYLFVNGYNTTNAGMGTLTFKF